jgi:hypothetical protein
MDHVENSVSNSSSIVAHELVAMGTCLFCGCYLVTGLDATICKVTYESVVYYLYYG